MKKKDTKLTQEQINAARQKKLSSSDFRGHLKNIIESLKLFNSTKKQKLSSKEIRDMASYFCERIDVHSTRVKESTQTETATDEVVPKNSIKY